MVDVDETNGPHVCISGSASDFDQKFPARSAYDRLSDEEVLFYGRPITLDAKGRFINTRDIIKAASKIRARLLVQLEYAHLNPIPRAALTPELQKLAQKEPRML